MKFIAYISFIWVIIWFTSLTSMLTAQMDTTVFAPVGASWYYSPSSFGPPWITNPLYVQFLVEKDTILMGYQARVIGCYVNEENQMIRVDSLSKYVTTIGNKVFYKVEDEFVLLYDFGANAGDTISSRVDDFPLSLGCGSDFSEGSFEFSYVIDSNTIWVEDDEELRVQFVNSIYEPSGPNWVFWAPIMERIGSLSFGGWWWGQGEGCILESGFLRCYIDNEIHWRSSSFYGTTPCDFTSTVNAEPFGSFNLYPNPASYMVVLPEGLHHLLLFDVTGRKYPIKIYGEELDISHLPSGVFMIRGEINGVWKVSSFVKME